jgi:hypothetical protein
VIKKTKLLGLSPQANYTDRRSAAFRRSWCQLLGIEGVIFSAQRFPTAVFSVNSSLKEFPGTYVHDARRLHSNNAHFKFSEASMTYVPRDHGSNNDGTDLKTVNYRLFGISN